MGEFFQTLWRQLKDFFGKMERKKLIQIGIIVALILVVIIISVSILSQKSYAVLVTDMDAKEAGTILNNLKEKGVDAKPRGDDTIVVPEDQVNEVRLQLAAEGLPQSGLNYDTFSKGAGIGATDMEKRTYKQYQLQEDLRTTINMMQNIKDSVVILNVAEESLLTIESRKKSSSASVVLELETSAKIPTQQARALGELVSKAVPNLAIEDVRIMDSTGFMYNLNEEEAQEPADVVVAAQLELQRQVRDQLQMQVLNLLNPVFGKGNIYSEVSVKLNFDDKKEESVKFEPPVPDEEGGIPISLKTLDETIKGSASAAQDAAGFDPNGAAPQYPATDTTDDDTVYQKVTSEVNYEINEIKSQIESAKGQVEKLTVSVVLNRNMGEEDFTEEVASLVASAVGVDVANVSVRRLPFDTTQPTDAELALQLQTERAQQEQSQQLTRTLIFAGTAIIIAVLVLIAVLSLRKKKAPVPELVPANMEGATFDVMVGDEDETDENSVIESRKSGVRGQVEEYIRRDPQSVAHLLRNWLSSDTR